MLIWRSSFPQQDKIQGERMFEEGLAAAERTKPHEYRVRVLASAAAAVSLVDVRLDSADHKLTGIQCTCGAPGGTCTHGAAAMYALEDKFFTNNPLNPSLEEEAAQRGIQVPSREAYMEQMEAEFRKTYHYFDFPAMMKDVRISPADWRAGYLMARLGRIRPGKIQIYDPDYIHSRGRGKADGTLFRKDGEYISSVDCRFSENRIDQLYCTSLYCYSYGYNLTFCRHSVALVLMLGEYLRTRNPGDVTGYRSKQFLREFQPGDTAAAETGDAPPLVLEPVLRVIASDPGYYRDEASEYLGMSFRIGMAGKGRVYKVRSLSELITKAEQGANLEISKKTRIPLSVEGFRDINREYFDMIRKWVIQKQTIAAFQGLPYGGDAGVKERRDILLLSGDLMDRVYDIACRYPVKMENVTGKAVTLAVREGEYRPVFQVKNLSGESGKMSGVKLLGEFPVMAAGSRYAYYLEGHTLFRTGLEEYQRVLPLLKYGRKGIVDLNFGWHSLNQFYRDVLPRIREFAQVDVEDPESIEAQLPPEVRFTFYLDAEQGDATCRVMARYGETDADLVQILQEGDGALTPEVRNIRRDTGNLAREKKVKETLEQVFVQKIKNPWAYSAGGDEDVIFGILTGGVQRLMDLGEVQSTQSFLALKVQRRPKVTVGASISGNLLDLKISAEDMDEDELADLLQSYRRKKKYHRLRSGDFVDLSDENFSTLDDLLEALDVSLSDLRSGRVQAPAFRALYLDRMIAEREELYGDRDRTFKKLVKEFKTIDDADYDVPASLKGVLRGYQKAGFRWLMTLKHYGFGGILADEMGLGKTLQVIAVILAEKEAQDEAEANETAGAAAEERLPSLVVAPASLVYNWREEFRRFAPKLNVQVIAGTKTERRRLLNDRAEWDVLVTSYDLLKRDIAEYEDISFDYEVIDEAQYIKNHNTAQSKAVKLIRSQSRIALTGTPIENRLSELWSIFDYLMPGFLYGYETFRRELENPVVKGDDEAALERLRRMIQPFVLRRLKADVLRDLPEKLEEVYYAGLEGEQKKLYSAQVLNLQKALRSQTDEDFRGNKIQVLAELTRIRQVCCEPGLVYENYRGGSAKREACMELVRQAIDGGHRILLFSQFTSMLDVLAENLKKEGIEYYTIQGSTPKEKRLELVDAFNGGTVPVFLISLKAGGFGLNLTGADMVIHYDPWWNVAAQNQATDRTHRIGQTRVVTVYRLIAKGTIEEKILELQEAKQKLADDILSGEAVASASLSREELLELLG